MKDALTLLHDMAKVMFSKVCQFAADGQLDDAGAAMRMAIYVACRVKFARRTGRLKHADIQVFGDLRSADKIDRDTHRAFRRVWGRPGYFARNGGSDFAALLEYLDFAWQVPPEVKPALADATPPTTRKGPRENTARRIVRQRDGGHCVYCGTKLRKGTLDHFVPKAAGGSNCSDNLVLACRRCNTLKDSKVVATVDEARVAIERERARALGEVRAKLRTLDRKLNLLGDEVCSPAREETETAVEAVA